MDNRFRRMMRVLQQAQSSAAVDVDVDGLAREFALTPGTVRRYLRELRDAGALAAVDTAPVLPGFGPGERPFGLSLAANDGASPHPVVLTEDELAVLHIGARFLASEGDPSLADAARRLLARLDHVVSDTLGERIADLDALYAFPSAEHEAEVRRRISQAIHERRVISLRYRRENDSQYVVREVEPLAQFYTDDHWSFLAFCRLRQDLRTFRHDRARSVQLTERYFTPRQGLSLERFIQRRKAQIRHQTPTG